MISELMAKIAKMIGVGTVCSKTGSAQYKVDLYSGETKNKLKLIQQRGFVSVPSSGDEVVCVFTNGDRNSGHIISVDDKMQIANTLGLKPGDVVIYSGAGNYILLSSATGKIKMKTEALIVNGINVIETLKVIIDKFNKHTNVGAGGINIPKDTITTMKEAE